MSVLEIIQKNQPNTNVSEPERWASVVAGGGLIAYGLTQRSWQGWALAALGGGLVYRGATGHCHTYQALGINTRQRAGQGGVPYELGIRVDQSITINKSPAELYRFWRNFENLPKFMDHLKAVRVMDGNRSHWVAKAPLGTSVEWDAEVVNEVPNQLIGWRSLAGSQVDNAGSVHFRATEDGRATEVMIELQYNPPAGYLGAAVAKLFGEEPNQQIRNDLRRFKQLMETGEVAATKSQTSGKSTEAKSDKPGKMWDRDKVGTASEESFPASDPPSWTPEALSKA